MLFITVFNQNVLCVDGACRGLKRACIMIQHIMMRSERGQRLNPMRPVVLFSETLRKLAEEVRNNAKTEEVKLFHLQFSGFSCFQVSCRVRKFVCKQKNKINVED